VKPRVGSVALFYSKLPNSDEKDWMAWHASCDVSNGLKWAANFWWHQDIMKRQTRRLSLEGCLDAQPECVGWAASGECVRNADYMRQLCRRSCGVCTV